MRTLKSITVVLGLMTAAVTVASPAAPARAAPVETNFGMAAFGYGTQVMGGQLPADSGRTARSALGCTNRAPITRQRTAATGNVDNLIRLAEVETTNTTRRAGGRVEAKTVNRIGNVRIGTTAAHLRIRGVTTAARAWHGAGTFKRGASIGIGDIFLKLPGAPEVPLPDLPLPGETPVVIPGIASITLGRSLGRAGPNGAASTRTALVVELLGGAGQPTVVRVGHASARIVRGFTGGVFGGSANTVVVRAANGALKTGPITPQPMPCKGTGGAWRSNSTASVRTALLRTGTVSAAVNGRQLANAARGRVNSELASVRLVGGALRIGAIEVKSSVFKGAGGTYDRAVYFAPVRVTANGETVTLGRGEQLNLPGIGLIRMGVVRQFATGVTATGVEINLLGGAVVRLGNTRNFIN
jgi:hypothetical protein